MIHSLCIVVGQPQGVELSVLALREAWAAHAYAIETKLLFFEDGVYALLRSPAYHSALLKDFIAEEGEVFCVRESLTARGILVESLVQGVELISKNEVADLIGECDAVNVF